MRKLILLILTFGLSLFSFGQISEGGLPFTFKKTIEGEVSEYNTDYQIIELNKPNMTSVYEEDDLIQSKHEGYRVGVLEPVNLTIQNSGTWQVMPNGDKIWRLAIKMQGAVALGLYFDENVVIPEGGRLYAYNQNHSQYVGAYTSNTPSFRSMEMIEGELLTLEYFMPVASTVLPTIVIGDVSYFYRGIDSRMQAFRDGFSIESQERSHQSCEVNVACSEITGWESQRDAVVKFTFSSNGGTFLCTGSMINNTNGDCKPYFLTANHCGEPTTNSDIAQHTFYFNYQRPTCQPGQTSSYSGAQSQTISGGTLKASSELGTHSQIGGITGSDFILIEFNSNVPVSYNAYYEGWSRTASGSGSGVGIHHPAGTDKMISTYSSVLSSATYNGGWSGAHWLVQWVATANGHGVTEGGSSGSPIFNADGLVVGHLSGGSSQCNATSETDLYGKFIKAWNGEGSNANQQLKPWLDPTNSGVMSLNGTYSPCDAGGGGAGTGFCVATSTHSCAAANEYISNVKLNTIDNATNCTNYSSFSSLSTDLVLGNSYDVTVTATSGDGAIFNNDEIAVWIDWNGDETFSAMERVGYALVSTGWSNVFNFTVPADAVYGSHKMRVRISYKPDDGDIDPCGTTEWGEVEDYTVKVVGHNLVAENELDNISIYPNPTNSDLFINLSDVSVDVVNLLITDVTGRIIKEIFKPSGVVKIELNAQSMGVYFVKLNSQNKSITKKVIKY